MRLLQSMAGRGMSSALAALEHGRPAADLDRIRHLLQEARTREAVVVAQEASGRGCASRGAAWAGGASYPTQAHRSGCLGHRPRSLTRARLAPASRTRKYRSRYRSGFVPPQLQPTQPILYWQVEPLSLICISHGKRRKRREHRILSPLPLPIGLWGPA
jgi:hypothetical protein